MRWWALFRTPLLSHYIRLALRTNPDLAAARATRARADALVDVAAAGLFPQVTAEATAARARALRAGANGGRAYRIPGDLYSLVLGAIRIRYRPDLFGQATDQVRSAKARRTVSAAWLRMTEVFLEASVARAVIQAADTEEQCRAAQRIATDDQSLLDLLRAQLAASRHALADLLGEYPNQTLRLPTLAAMRLPARLPTAIPSALLEQRPDIIAARAEIQAARANVDLAAANRFPQLQITAAFGKAAQSGNLFFNPLSTLWSLGAGVLAPIYDGGALAARERAAVAQYRIAGDRYRATVLEAFEQVADALRALHSDERTYEESRIAESAATQALRLAHGRYRDGSIAYSSVLDAEIAAQRDTQAAIEANSRRYLDAVALFLALGEGWSEAQGGANGGARS